MSNTNAHLLSALELTSELMRLRSGTSATVKWLVARTSAMAAELQLLRNKLEVYKKQLDALVQERGEPPSYIQSLDTTML